MNSKHCPYCHSNIDVIKFGTTSSKRQRFKCKKCGRTWTSKPHIQVLAKFIWDDFIFHNMNMSELANRYKMSGRSIRRKMGLYSPPKIPSQADVIVMDVAYFGRSWGLLMVLNVHNSKVLYCEPTSGYETVWDYEKAILELAEYGVHPKAAVVDGKKGVINMLEDYGILVQMCQFHQKRIVRTCITNNPIYDENKDLKDITDSLTHVKRNTFETMIYVWRTNNFNWLKERTYYDNGKWEYTHKLTRRAIRSLFHNLPYLFTFEDYPELNIPNTNNKLEGIHSELKRRLANRRGLKKQQKIQFARIFLSGRTEV